MQFGVTGGSQLSRKVEPCVRAKAGAWRCDADDEIDGLAMVGEPALKNKRSHQAGGSCPGQRGDDRACGVARSKWRGRNGDRTLDPISLHRAEGPSPGAERPQNRTQQYRDAPQARSLHDK